MISTKQSLYKTTPDLNTKLLPGSKHVLSYEGHLQDIEHTLFSYSFLFLRVKPDILIHLNLSENEHQPFHLLSLISDLLLMQ